MSDLYVVIERLVRAIVGDFKYFKLYPCAVQSQTGMSLDLLPDDEEIRGPGGLGGVPLRVGLPGFEVVVPHGARVLLGFDNGDPRRPYASLFDPGNVTSIKFAGGELPNARQGDLVVSGGVGLIVSFTPVVPTPGPMTAGQPYLISFSAVPPTPVSADPLYGSIATGRTEFMS